MILVGNSRGSAQGLAQHLLNTHDNEKVEVHEVSGFVSDTLTGALNEAQAVSRGTKCQKFLFSLSLNPPKDATVDVADFERAVDQAEEKLGLTGQPRAVVFHEKKGEDGLVRRHCHAVWSRIDTQQMKAIPMDFHKRRCQDVSRELFREHGWEMPKGHENPLHRNPTNFSLAEWQQAKRAKKDVKALKSMFADCWAQSDSKAAFAHALKERGYVLAQGDRRGFIAVDHKGEAYSISKYAGVKAKDTRARFGSHEDLPTKDEAHVRAANVVTTRLDELKSEQTQQQESKLERLKTEEAKKNEQHREQQTVLSQHQTERQQHEDSERQSRFRTGLWGFVDRFTGRHKRTEAENQAEILQHQERDKTEQQRLEQSQAQSVQATEQKKAAVIQKSEAVTNEIKTDIQNIQSALPPDVEQRRQEYMKLREARRQSPARTRARDGPSLEP
ncbi:MAG: relaxase [Pseudomonadota bacterium]